MGKQGPCCHCGVANTPLWRNGPPEKPVLCNACGSRWRTKGSLVNYTPLHSRADDYEGRRGMRKAIPLKKKEERPYKRKPNYEYQKAMDREYIPDYNRGHQKNIDEDMSNRSSSGSSNSDSCAQFGNADASELTGPSQSIVWDGSIPSRKRTCVTRAKQSPVEKLTKDLYTIFHNQASKFSNSSEEDLLYESDAPMVSVEIGHGSVLIRHPSSLAREEESEASSFSVDNKLCRSYEKYSNVPSMLSVNDSKSVNNSFSRVEEVNRLNDKIVQMERLNRHKYNHEKFQVLCDHNSALSYIDLIGIVNLDVFGGYLTDGEQQSLLKYLPSADASAGFDSLESMFTSSHFRENLSSFQQLLAEGVLDTSFPGVETEDCKDLKRLALSNSSKCKWVEHYNILKHKGAENSSEGHISQSGANSCFTGTLLSGKKFGENSNHIDAETACTMKSPKRVVQKVDYKRKGALQNGESYLTPTSKNVFALPTHSGSLLVDSIHYVDEITDQDLLLDVPSNGSFPQAELLCPPSSFKSQQASASSSSIHQSHFIPCLTNNS